MKHEHIVKEVEQFSIADELGIEPGDKLISINDNEIEDVFDYHYYVNDEELVLLIEKPDVNSGNWKSKKITMKIWESHLNKGLWMNTVLATTSVCSALSISFQKV